MSQSKKDPIYWSFSGPDSWRMSVDQISSAFLAGPELVEELERRAQPVEVAADGILFKQGDEPKGVYIVRNGLARLTSRSDGDAIMSLKAGAGSLLGLPAVVGSKPYSLTAEALAGAEISLLSSDDFVHLMHTEPLLSFRVLQVLAEEVRFARESIAHL
jgi:CRP-like cAMP-binding protein